MAKLTAAKVKSAAKQAAKELAWPETQFVAGAAWCYRTYIENKNDPTA